MKGAGELVLYLDYDGVLLHHENVLWHPRIGAYLSAPDGYVLFQHAELLEQILAPYPQVRIVLSTTWVRRYGRATAAKNLRPALRSRVIGATFHSRMDEQQFSEVPRGMQVWSDVLRRQPRDWLALDDDWLDWQSGVWRNTCARMSTRVSATRPSSRNLGRSCRSCARDCGRSHRKPGLEREAPVSWLSGLVAGIDLQLKSKELRT